MTDDAASQAQFEFVPADERGPATVWAAGDIDLTNVGRFQAALDAAAAAGTFTVDLTSVTYCDSATIRALITAARQARLTIVVGAIKLAAGIRGLRPDPGVSRRVSHDAVPAAPRTTG